MHQPPSAGSETNKHQVNPNFNKEFIDKPHIQLNDKYFLI